MSQANEIRPVPVTIFGQEYTLRTDEDGAYIEGLASYVDERMRLVADRTRTADTAKIAILAALNIADELHKGGRGRSDAPPDEAGRASRIEELLDRVLA